MKYVKLEKDEREILRDFEKGKLKPVKNIKKEKTRYQKYAAATLRSKKKAVSL